jgi:hypothetical protein
MSVPGKSKYGNKVTWVDMDTLVSTQVRPEKDYRQLRFPSKLEAATYVGIRKAVQEFYDKAGDSRRHFAVKCQVPIRINSLSPDSIETKYVADFLVTEMCDLFEVRSSLKEGSNKISCPFLVVESKGLWIPSSALKVKALLSTKLLNADNFLIVGSEGPFDKIPRINTLRAFREDRKSEIVKSKIMPILEAKW